MSVSRRSGRANANGIPGRPAPLPMSAIRSLGIQKFRDRRTIQYVAVPQPVHFAGTEQPPFDTRAGQDFRVPLGAIQPRSEEGLGRSRRRGHLHMFHVKHPPDLAGRKRAVAARTTSV